MTRLIVGEPLSLMERQAKVRREGYRDELRLDGQPSYAQGGEVGVGGDDDSVVVRGRSQDHVVVRGEQADVKNVQCVVAVVA